MEGKVSVANEVRIREDSFGLTPAGRQQRRWLIVDNIDTETPDELAEKRRKAQRRRELEQKLR